MPDAVWSLLWSLQGRIVNKSSNIKNIHLRTENTGGLYGIFDKTHQNSYFFTSTTSWFPVRTLLAKVVIDVVLHWQLIGNGKDLSRVCQPMFVTKGNLWSSVTNSVAALSQSVALLYFLQFVYPMLDVETPIWSRTQAWAADVSSFCQLLSTRV